MTSAMILETVEPVSLSQQPVMQGDIYSKVRIASCTYYNLQHNDSNQTAVLKQGLFPIQIMHVASWGVDFQRRKLNNLNSNES